MERQIKQVEEIMAEKPPRDYLAEALDIIVGEATSPRLLVRMPEREHLIALAAYYEHIIGEI